MPFVLAPVGDLVAVEATDADDRATYILRVDDVDKLNAVLVLTTFRREAVLTARRRARQVGDGGASAGTGAVVAERARRPCGP